MEVEVVGVEDLGVGVVGDVEAGVVDSRVLVVEVEEEGEAEGAA